MIDKYKMSLLLFLTLTSSSPAFAGPLDDYNAGVNAYKSKNFRLAATCLQKATDAGYSSTAAWMYLGHAYTGLGDKANAVKAYQGLISNFRGTPEAGQAYAYIARLDPAALSQTAGSDKILPPAQQQKQAEQAAQDAARAQQNKTLTYPERVYVVSPRRGHQAVNPHTVAAIKVALSRLPKSVLAVLNNYGASTNIAPNIEDKWPGSGDDPKPRDPAETLGEEGGRTYGRETYIYERRKIRGRDEMSPPRSADDMIQIMYYQIGHQLDDSLGVVSKDGHLRALYQQDWTEIPDDLKHRYDYYADPGEGCACLIGNMLGRKDPSGFNDYMPRTRSWLKTRLKL